MLEAVRSAGGYLLDGIHTPSAYLALLHTAIPVALVLPSSLKRQPSTRPPPCQVVIDTSGRSAGNAVLQTISVSGLNTMNLRATVANCLSPHQHDYGGEPGAAQQHGPSLTTLHTGSDLVQPLQALLQGLHGSMGQQGDDGKLGCRGQAACPVAYASPPQDDAEGFSIHPASADSCMHVGTLCGNPDGRIRVPGALGAFLAEPLGYQGTTTAGQSGSCRGEATRSRLNERWAVGMGEAELPDGTRRLSFRLSPHGRSPGMVMAELEAKVARLGASGILTSGMAVHPGPACLMCWLIAHH